MHDVCVHALPVLEQGFDVCLYCAWLGLGRVALHDLSVFIDEKFGEIPFDGFRAEDPWLCTFQVLIEWMCVVAVDVDLLEQRKGGLEVQAAEFLYLFCAAGFLASELVAREGQYFETAGMQLIVELL